MRKGPWEPLLMKLAEKVNRRLSIDKCTPALQLANRCSYNYRSFQFFSRVASLSSFLRQSFHRNPSGCSWAIAIFWQHRARVCSNNDVKTKYAFTMCIRAQLPEAVSRTADFSMTSNIRKRRGLALDMNALRGNTQPWSRLLIQDKLSGELFLAHTWSDVNTIKLTYQESLKQDHAHHAWAVNNSPIPTATGRWSWIYGFQANCLGIPCCQCE